MALSSDSMQALNKIRSTAMRILALREHSELELLQKLRAKGFLEEDIQSILKQLTQEDLLSNTRFIDNYIYSRSRKGYGPLRIREELRERGIAEEIIEHHLNIADNAWFINVRNVWQKRFKNQIPDDFKTRAQQMRFLQYRGFTQKQINSIFQSDI